MKISIIGSGWLAQPLALSLQEDGHELLLTTTQSAKVALLHAKGLKAIEYVLGDQLSNPSMLFDADVLIIAITSKEIADYDVLLDQLTEQNCQHLLYISSTAVYQNNGQTHAEDSTAMNQDHPIYQIEQLIQSHPSASVIRFAGLVGPNRHPGRFFANGKTMKIPTAPVNLIHLADCTGIIKAVIDNKAWNQTFNGCADNHPKKIDYYGTMATQIGLPRPAAAVADESASFKIINNHKVKAVLNYQLKYPDVVNMEFD